MPNISKTPHREEPKDIRSKLIAQIHIAKKDFNLTDENYRCVLFATSGKDSSADMSIAELSQVLDGFRKNGWQPKVKRGGKARPIRNSAPQAKIWALWFHLKKLGVVEGDARKTLNAWLKKQCGVDAIEFVNTPELEKIAIEGLKGWIKRVERKK